MQDLLKHNVLESAEFNSGAKVVRQQGRNRKPVNARNQTENSLQQWYGFKRGERSPEALAALRVMQQRQFLSEDSKFRRLNKAPLPEFYQVGTVVADPLRPHQRLAKKFKRATLIDEIAASPDIAGAVSLQRHGTMMDGVVGRTARGDKPPPVRESDGLGFKKRAYKGTSTRKALHTQLRKSSAAQRGSGGSKGKGR